ncbi:MAG: hypothetical protein EAZ89_04090 [Bacteroidetes bacterium]|nr:MAG: hypothetical protein EAZ89_04090 [Bacteroidota bacterium]
MTNVFFLPPLPIPAGLQESKKLSKNRVRALLIIIGEVGAIRYDKKANQTCVLREHPVRIIFIY